MASRALVIAPQPFFSPRGTPLSVYYRTLVTAELGVEVDLLTYGEGQDVDIPGVRIIRIRRFPFLGNVKVGPSLLKLFLDVFLVGRTVGLLLRRRYDFVHAHEESVFFCRFLKPVFRFKLVYDMHSSLPQQLRNFNFTRSRLLIGLFERLERTCLAEADAVITICPALAEQALPLMPDRRRHFLIENSIFEEIRLRNGVGKRSEVTRTVPLPEESPIVAYAGTFEDYQGLDILIPAFAEVLKTRPDAFLLLVGGSPTQLERYQRLAADVGINGRCIFLGRIAKNRVREYLGRAAVLTSPRKEGTNTPLKVYEQLASGKPLVATRIYAHTQILDDSVCFLVDPDPGSMAEGILSALSDEDRRRRVVSRARALYERKYSRPAYEAKMRQLLEVVT